jgi:glycine hydroxymethyltransferase
MEVSEHVYSSSARMNSLERVDPEIADLIRKEEERQDRSIRLIPSENYASQAVMEATGSILTNKYSEGYPGKRYYEGQDFIDRIEELAIDRAKKLFGAEHINVQPYSGSPANQAVYLALLKPGDTVMGLSLPFGGHLTHGWKVNFSGITYRAVQYELDPQTHLVDLDKVAELARRERPKLIFTGGTAYPRIWNFADFARIAREVGAVLVADIAHISGLVAGGAHPSPFPHAPIVTTTTHKTLRGPRGGMILCSAEYAKPIDRAVFPGLQGGPHNHTTAGLAVALREADTQEFKAYAHQIVKNAKALAEELNARGFRLISGGTDNHLILIDTTAGGGERPGMSGKPAAKALAKAGIECNYNTIPFDTRKPMDPSGIRIGTPSVTSRGMKEAQMQRIAAWIDDAMKQAADPERLERIRKEVGAFCEAFPPPGIRI